MKAIKAEEIRRQPNRNTGSKEYYFKHEVDPILDVNDRLIAELDATIAEMREELDQTYYRMEKLWYYIDDVGDDFELLESWFDGENAKRGIEDE